MKVFNLDVLDREEQIRNASVVLCTNACAGNLGNQKFLIHIIDEASTSSLASVLVGMVRSNVMVVMLGDHKQLPPFLHKTEEPVEKLSFFEQCVNLGVQRHVLNIQYRMHSDILSFPNETFYMGKITCVKGLKERREIAKLKFLSKFSWPLDAPHLVIVDCSDGREKRKESSICNSLEAKLCARITGRLAAASDIDIAVITFYRAQVDELRSRMTEENIDIGPHVQVDTVDAFQGREAEVVIISMVRTGTSVGFLSEPRRINVALTRAKTLLIVLCNVDSIQKDPLLDAWYRHSVKSKIRIISPKDLKEWMKKKKEVKS